MKGFEVVLRNRPGFHGTPSRMLIPELDGIQGRPDLVDAHIQVLPFPLQLGMLATSLRSPAKARLLAVLRHGAPRSRTYLERVTGLSNRFLGEQIRQLDEAGLIKVNRNSSVSLSSPLPWYMVDIISYEGKLSNWRRALHQAVGYRSFSSSVRVVMPISAAQRAKRLETVFRSNGIGLIGIDEDGGQHVEIRSRKRRPASRRLYLMAVGAVLSKFLDERKSLTLLHRL